jgi:hypothetical protein
MQQKSCTERGTYLYKFVQKAVPSKEIIQLLCDPQNENVHVFEFTVLSEM